MFQAVNKKWLQVWSSKIIRIVFVTVAAHSSSISVGMTQGYSSVLLPQLSARDSSLPVTKEQASWIASLGVITTPFGALISGLLVDVLGRKSAIIVTSIPFLIGWLTTAFATDVALLYVGRIVCGLAAGMTSVNYLYVAEVASKEHRSVLSAFGPILVSLGVLIVYTAGFLTTWERTALISSAFSALTVVSMLSAPESPAWYVSKNEPEEAYRSLIWLRRDGKSAEIELKALVNSKTEREEEIKEATAKLAHRIFPVKLKFFFDVAKLPEVYRPFFILLFFFLFQIGSGIYVFLFYATQIFREFGTDYDENLITVTVGLFRFLMAILGAFLMAKIGRRPLGMFSGICMSLALIFLCVYQFAGNFVSPTYQFLPFVAVLFHVGFSMTGFLQLPWILTSELFPLHCRGILSGIVSSFAYLCIFASVKTYLDLLRILRLEGLLVAFLAMSFLGTLFVYFFVPETKDRSLKEISRDFARKVPPERARGGGLVTISGNVVDVSTVEDNSHKLNPEMIFDKSMVTVSI